MSKLFLKMTMGQKTVTTAGQGEQMPSVVIPENHFVTVRALNANTGNIYIADSLTNVGIAANRFILAVGESIDLQIANLNLLWIGATVSGEGVEYIVEVD